MRGGYVADQERMEQLESDLLSALDGREQARREAEKAKRLAADLCAAIGRFLSDGNEETE